MSDSDVTRLRGISALFLCPETREREMKHQTREKKTKTRRENSEGKREKILTFCENLQLSWEILKREKPEGFKVSVIVGEI